MSLSVAAILADIFFICMQPGSRRIFASKSVAINVFGIDEFGNMQIGKLFALSIRIFENTKNPLRTQIPWLYLNTTR